MKTILLIIAAALALAGCKREEPDRTPVTNVNAPVPTNIVTNVPPAK
jgi:hypothetical protein